jgi:peptidoglycan hydrolase-like protein with peptidoglycan-binding domain
LIGTPRKSGVTDGEGKIDEPISPGARQGQLIFGEGADALEYEFQLSTLDPVESLTGIQARLTNLGYNPGPVDGILGPKTTAAIEDFCAQNEIDSPDQGEISQQFCDTLTQAHGF